MGATEAAKPGARASEQITNEVTSWPGVEVDAGRRGEFALRIGRREIGHLRGNNAAHFQFPKPMWSELMRQGRIEPHPVFPTAHGPAAHEIRSDDDVADVLRLMGLNYDRLAGGVGATPTRTQAAR